MRDVPYLVRVYEITVYAMTWEPVTALFLPRVPPERLLDFLPRPECYAFNEDYVETELRFYGIRDDDRTYIKDVLRRIGKTSYNVEKRGYRIFQIDLKDGTLTSRDASM